MTKKPESKYFLFNVSDKPQYQKLVRWLNVTSEFHIQLNSFFSVMLRQSL